MNGITLEELKVIIDAQTKPFRDELKKIKEETSKTTNSVMQSTNKIKNMFGGVKKFLVGLGITTAMYKIAKSGISMATQVESATQQVNRLMGESAQAFMRWGKENALALNMSQKDFAQYSSVYANLLSSFIHSTSGVANQTAKLLQASAVIQSATGRTMQDVMERIRSGLLGNTEAIEDLGINVNVALLESTEAFRKFAGDKSWQQLDFQTQQQIRLMAILEQTSNKFGDSVHQNTNTSLAMCAAIIKDIALNIGNTLLPLLNMVLPVVINIGMAVRNATQYMADFMTTLFGNGSKTTASATKSQNKYVDSLNATTDAAKKAKKALGGLMGLDELTVITSPNSSSNESNSSSNANYNFGGDLFAEEPKTNGVQNAVDKVRKKIDEFKKYMKTNAPVITSLIAGIVTGLAAFKIVKNWADIVKFVTPLSEAFQFLGLQISTIFAEIAKGAGIFKALSAAFTPVIAKATLIAGGVTAVTAALVYLYQTSEPFRNLVNEAVSVIWNTLNNFYISVLQPIFSFLIDVYDTVIKPIASFIATVFVDAVEAIATVTLALWNNVLSPIANFLIDILGLAIQKVIDKFNEWKPVFEYIGLLVSSLYENYLKPFVEEKLSKFVEKLEGTKVILETLFAGFKEWIAEKLSVFNDLPEIVTITAKGIIDSTFTTMKTAIENVKNSEVYKTIKGKIDETFTSIKSTFDAIKNTEAYKTIKGTVEKTFTSLKSSWDAVVNGSATKTIKGLKDKTFDTIKSAWDAVSTKTATISLKIESLTGDIKGWINTNIIAKLNAALDKTSLSWINIPKLAHGGIVNRSVLANIGEAGSEAVIPLERNTGGIQKIAQKISSFMDSSDYNSDVPEILMAIIDVLESMEFNPVVEVDGEKIARIVNKANKRMARRQGYSY